MDLSDLAGGARHVQDPERPHTVAPIDPQALIGQLGREVASALSSALDRVTRLAATGRIDRKGLRALRDEIERARRAGITGQQVVRLASGEVNVARERLDLTELLLEALRQRGREIAQRSLELRQTFAAATVMSDSTLLFSLLQTTLDWTFDNAKSRIDLTLDVVGWPVRAQLVVAFACQAPDEIDAEPDSAGGIENTALDSMSWRLLQRTADVLGLPIRRRDVGPKTELTIEFPDTAPANQVPGTDVAPEPLPTEAQPLAGHHLVVLSTRREIRNSVRDALRPMGLMLDFVTTVEQAQELCAGDRTHAIVYEATLGGDRFDRLRQELQGRLPAPAFVQIAEQGRTFEVLNLDERQYVSVGRDAVIELLPAALLFEFSRQS